MVILNDVKNSDKVTLIVHRKAGAENMEPAVKRGIKSGVHALNNGVIQGHGWIYLMLAREIRNAAITSSHGRESMAMEAAADVMEDVYKTLAINAGQDPIDSLISAKKLLANGTNVEKIVPEKLFNSILERAMEASVSMLRTDEVFSVKPLGGPGNFSSSSGITVYTSDGCPYCTQAKEYLRSKGVSFREVNVSRDPSGVQEMMSVSGQTGTPVTVIKGQAVVGFDRARLDSLL